MRNIVLEWYIVFVLYDTECFGGILGSVSTLDICVLENTTSPRFWMNALLQFLEKSLRDIPELYVQFYQKEAMLQYILGALRNLTNVTLVLCACTLSCPSLCDPLDCSPAGSTVHGIFQARALELGCRFLLQQIFSTQGSNPHLLRLLHWQADSLPLCHLRLSALQIGQGYMQRNYFYVPFLPNPQNMLIHQWLKALKKTSFKLPLNRQDKRVLNFLSVLPQVNIMCLLIP